MAYEDLAVVYDLLMDEIDYAAWADYLDELLRENHCPGNRLLDLGCGTGSITVRMAQRGYQVTAVDVSAPMLERARAKAEAAGVEVDWRLQDLAELDLSAPDGTAPVFDAAIATFDVCNHLTDPEALQDLFQRLRARMRDGGLLILDLQTPYKLRTYLGEHTFTLHRPEIEYIWENQFDAEDAVCRMELTFFLRQENGLYRRLADRCEERVYEPELLRLWLHFCDMEVLGVYRALSREPLEERDLRAVLVARATPAAELWSDAAGAEDGAREETIGEWSERDADRFL